MATASGSGMRPGERDRIKASRRHKARLTTGRAGSAGEGQVPDKSSDRGLAHNRQARGAASHGTGLSASLRSQAERLSARVSAYLDGQMTGKDRAAFEAMLHSDEGLLQEVAELRQIGVELREMGADILAEPVPEFLLEAGSHLPLG